MTTDRADPAPSPRAATAFRALLTGLETSALTLALLVLPQPEEVRRPVVAGLLVVLAVLLVSVAIVSRRSRAHRRPRFRGLLGVYQGAVFGAAAAGYVYLTHQAPPLLCAGAGVLAGAGFGTVMWFALPGLRRPEPNDEPGTAS